MARVRAKLGGRSKRWEEGHRYRVGDSATTLTGRARRAPNWTDAAATLALDTLVSMDIVGGVLKRLCHVLHSPDALRRFASVAAARGSRTASTLACSIMEHHAGVHRTLSDAASNERADRVRSTLVRRGRAPCRLAAFCLPSAGALSPPSFHAWLDTSDELDSCVSPAAGRAATHLDAWSMPPSSPDVVVCVERAASCLLNSHSSALVRLSATDAAAITHAVVLPTAVGNPADHYILCTARRHFSPREYCRVFGVPPSSPLWTALTSGVLSTNQIGTACGRAAHPVSILALLRHFDVAARFASLDTVRYGSAFSGLDFPCEALDILFPDCWQHVFASEVQSTLRDVLCDTWGERGLVAAYTYSDALEAIDAPVVDLFFAGAPCGAYSINNRHRSALEIARSLSVLDHALDYVRTARPAVVIIENVSSAEAVDGITAIVTRLRSYEWHGGLVDTLTHGGLPMARDRYFWIGFRI